MVIQINYFFWYTFKLITLEMNTHTHTKTLNCYIYYCLQFIYATAAFTNLVPKFQFVPHIPPLSAKGLLAFITFFGSHASAH